MWANTPPNGGLIALGVEDDGTITGCGNNGKGIVDVERRVQSDLARDAKFVSKPVQVTNAAGVTDFVQLLRVYFRDDLVVETNKGEAYIRRNNSKHLLTDAEKHELKIERGQTAFELEACSLRWPDDF